MKSNSFTNPKVVQSNVSRFIDLKTIQKLTIRSQSFLVCQMKWRIKKHLRLHSETSTKHYINNHNICSYDKKKECTFSIAWLEIISVSMFGKFYQYHNFFLNAAIFYFFYPSVSCKNQDDRKLKRKKIEYQEKYISQIFSFILLCGYFSE